MKITRTHSIKSKYLAMIYDALLYVVFAVFEKIHYQHYKQTWNGKKQLKTIAITGLRSALVDDISQRTRIVFYWKVGKYYI
jgi:hypothetical protein